MSIIGKLYSENCIHCINMADEWTKLTEKLKGGSIEFNDIEASKMEQGLNELNNKIGGNEKVEVQGGYPTIYAVHDKKVHYYNGKRDAKSMEDWVKSIVNKKGGDGPGAPMVPATGGLLDGASGSTPSSSSTQAVVGGKRRKSRKSKKSKSRKTKKSRK